MAAKCTLINHLNASPLSSLRTIEKKAREERKNYLNKNYALPHRKTSFCGKRRRKKLGKTTKFSLWFFGCVLWKRGRREKQMGKLCAVLITFSPSSGRRQFSSPRKVRWVKLSLISFLERMWKHVLKIFHSTVTENSFEGFPFKLFLHGFSHHLKNWRFYDQLSFFIRPQSPSFLNLLSCPSWKRQH